MGGARAANRGTEHTFVLADIGGYTQFLTDVSLEHAEEITSHLLNGLLEANAGRWSVANVEGDCVFFRKTGREPPGALLAHISHLYEDFRLRVIEISARSSCPCGACARTSQLALKFAVHAGEAAEQRVGSSREVIGPDVVTAHRLLKNTVPLAEYVLFTDAYLQGAAPPWPSPAQSSVEQYPDIGEVACVYVDLSPARRNAEERTRIFVTPDTAQYMASIEIEAQAERVWSALRDVDQRALWDTTVERVDWQPGRPQGEWGSVHTCFHRSTGPTVHVQVALDEEGCRATDRLFPPTTLAKQIYVTGHVESLEEGRTRLSFLLRYTKASPLTTLLGLPLQFATRRIFRRALVDLKRYCEAPRVDKGDAGTSRRQD